MKKPLLMIFFLLIACPSITFAHKPLLMVDDNEDGTIYIETGFSEGSSGAGHIVRLKDAATGKILSETKIPEDGSLDMKKPPVPYIVVFDAGEGHVVEAVGPALSSGSEAVEQQQEKSEPEVVQPVAAPEQNPEAANSENISASTKGVVAQPVETGHGFAAAYKMMIGTQIFISMGVFLIFGVLMFGIGQRWEISRQRRS